jgi:hypothetical protein
VLSTSETKESCNTGKDPAPQRGKAAKKHKGSFAQVKRVVLPFDVVILPLAVFLCRVLEFLHATAQTAHKLRNLAASEKQQYHEDNQNDLCRSNGSHPVDFGAKFGEKTSSRNKENAKVRQTPVSAHKITAHWRQATLSIKRTPPHRAATKTRIFPDTHSDSKESPCATLKYSTSKPKDSKAAVASGHFNGGSGLSATRFNALYSAEAPLRSEHDSLRLRELIANPSGSLLVETGTTSTPSNSNCTSLLITANCCQSFSPKNAQRGLTCSIKFLTTATTPSKCPGRFPPSNDEVKAP